MVNPDPFWLCVIFIVGASVGSFVNVVILRLPRGESLANPPSHCPVCGKTLSFFDMIPVLSYVALRGKCRHCGCRISPMYPLVESFMGILFLYLGYRYGLTLLFFRQAVLLGLLLAVTVIDIREMLIPDELVLSGAVFWVSFLALSKVLSAWVQGPLKLLCEFPVFTKAAAEATFHATTDRVGAGLLGPPTCSEDLIGDLARGLLGGALGFLVFLAISLVTRGMGGGDVKLAGMCGLYLGPALTILAVFIAFVSGGVVAALLLLSGKARAKSHIPYGPFIALGAAISSLWGEQIILWYLARLLP
ncbi:MAG: prepilin peptidase [Firmicutes bacterium]|nr:prepilin peptidase [Candidatus Fermentithermobacillaceae bacterium]